MFGLIRERVTQLKTILGPPIQKFSFQARSSWPFSSPRPLPAWPRYCGSLELIGRRNSSSSSILM